MTTSAQGKVHKDMDEEFGLEEIDGPAQSSDLKTFWMYQSKDGVPSCPTSLSDLTDGLLKE